MVDSQNTRLKATGLSYSIGSSRILDGFTLKLQPGEVVGLIGPNGAGKTTAVDLLSGFLRAENGSVKIGARDITHGTPYARAILGLTRTFQESPAISGLTVLEHLQLSADAVRSHRQRDVLSPDDLLSRFALKEMSNISGATLPTGCRRLLDIARAVATEPTILLLDEPFSGLSDEEFEIVKREIGNLKLRGSSVLIIEHRLRLLRDVADWVLALVQGVIVTSGPLETVLMHPEIQKAYLGQCFREEQHL